jgi:hypothetical protein
MRLPGGTAADFCTELACPKPGTVAAFWVQAVWPEETSDPSNIVTCWFQPGPKPCDCQDPAKAIPQHPLPPPPLVTTRPPVTLPVLTTTPPPLPQRTAEGLNLLPVGELPPLPTVPPIPEGGGA